MTFPVGEVSLSMAVSCSSEFDDNNSAIEMMDRYPVRFTSISWKTPFRICSWVDTLEDGMIHLVGRQIFWDLCVGGGVGGRHSFAQQDSFAQELGRGRGIVGRQ